MDALPLPEPPPPPEMRDWSELPLDALSLVFSKLGAVEVLCAGLVCRPWLRAAKLPHLWRCVDMAHHRGISWKKRSVWCKMAEVAVNRSGGQLEAFKARMFVTTSLYY
ncbi:hypothetical protein E2562_000497 [Oryza meyeriana var. granulata]|uniref:F-box domain-containing protein n=1 Tax=Oryza meyeriana var. granulata TaxID=110450 RepID=A0A6G1CCQ3_9ORYZ|nr:hypothetical protein E2562_000497 [Oryza meyeriana var. granulata]